MTGTREDLGNGYALRALAGEDDARKFIDLNQDVTGEGPICDRIIHHRPGAELGHFLVVEEARSGAAVSTTCLIPWELRYCGVPLRTTMVEMVVTHPDHRQKGLVSAQFRRLHRAMDEMGTDIAIIQGVPYYYRQYGYAYALDHGLHIELPADRVPSTWCPAHLEAGEPRDYPALHALYRGASARWGLHAARATDAWEYLHAKVGLRYRLIRSAPGGAPAGYASCAPTGWSLHVNEQVCADAAAAQGFLAWAREQKAGPISIHACPADSLWQLVLSLGGTPVYQAQWLVRFPAPGKLLQKIGPVLQARAEAAGYPSLDTTLTINLFRRAYRLKFAAGRLASVEDAGFIDTSMSAKEPGDLLIPPDAFVRLVLGYRGIVDLKDAWPETWVNPAARHLVEALFPRLESFIELAY